MRTVRQELSYALYRGNARMDNRSLLARTRDVGRGFMCGFERADNKVGDVKFVDQFVDQLT